MSSLLDDLRRVPTPESVRSREPLFATVKEAQVALFRAAAGQNNGEEKNSTAVVLRRYALRLEQSAFVHGNMDDSILEVACALYEFAANLSSLPVRTIFRPPLNDWIRSAIVASHAPYQGKASITARRIESLLQDREASSPVDACNLLVTRIIVSFLSRRFHEAFLGSRNLAGIQGEARITQEEQFAGQHETDQLNLAIRIGHACAGAAAGMLAGVPILIEASVRELVQIRELASDQNDSDHFWLADRLSRTAYKMSQDSMHRRLGFPGSPIPPKYRHALAREGYLELWGPQIDAIERGILNASSRSNFVISVPTGSGKTLLAEFLILSSLANNNGWGVYIAPSRSLASQISHELRRRLEPCGIDVQTIMAGAEQSLYLEQELSLMTRAKSLVVTTPEKLDTYFRNAPELFDSCRLLIVDEAHKINDEQRGPLIESLIGRFLVIHPTVRIALMSGVMSNPEEFDAWLGGRDTESVVSRRRPTRHIYGVAVRQNSPLIYGEPEQKKVKKSNKTKTSRRVEFQGGLVVVGEDDDLAGEIIVDLENVFQGHYWEKIRRNEWVADRDQADSPITDHAVKIAESLAAAPGTILIFINNTTWVESSSKKFTYSYEAHHDRRDDLASFLALELGASHDLVRLARRGVAYHHARLPNSVQRAIEFALERGWLKAVFATSSLREGINTPATTVIVAGLTYWGKSGSIPISAMDFANLSGRAGRPRADTEGRIILVPESLAEARAISAGREYVLSGDEARKVRSQLRLLKDALEQANGNIEAMPIDQQRVLLGLKAAELTDEDGVAAFLDSTLWALQESDFESLRRLVTLATRAFINAEEQIGDRLSLAAKIGMSLTSAEALRDTLLEDIGLFDRGDVAYSRNLQSQVKILLRASLSTDEIREQIDHADGGADMHLAPLLAWIDGETYESILAAGKATGLFKKSANVGTAVNHSTDFSNWLSWSFGAAWAIIVSELDDPDPEVGILPLLVRYGVPSTSGAFMSLLGVSDRNAALELSREFDETGLEATLQTVSSWMQSIDLDSVFPAETHHLRSELLRRQAFRGRRPSLPYEFASFSSDRDMAVGTILSIRRVGREAIVFLDGEAIGAVVAEERFSVLTLIEGSSREPYVVVVDAATQTQRGAIVVVV